MPLHALLEKYLKWLQSREYVLRSGKKLKVQSTMAENVEELSRLVKSLAEKSDKLEAISQSRHDAILMKLTTLETKRSELSAG